MTERLPLLYWDAGVFTEYIEDNPSVAPLIDLLLADARSGEIEIVTSVVSIAEVAYANAERLAGTLSLDVEQKIDGLWVVGGPVRTVEVYPLIATRARHLIRNGVSRGWTGLRANDAIHLATAQQLRADEIHTFDDKWARYSQELGILIHKPRTREPRIV